MVYMYKYSDRRPIHFQENRLGSRSVTGILREYCYY